VAVTVKVAVCVVYMDTAPGWFEINGPGATSITLRVAFLLVVDPPALETTTENWAPSSAITAMGVV